MLVLETCDAEIVHQQSTVCSYLLSEEAQDAAVSFRKAGARSILPDEEWLLRGRPYGVSIASERVGAGYCRIVLCLVSEFRTVSSHYGDLTRRVASSCLVSSLLARQGCCCCCRSPFQCNAVAW